MSYRYNRQRLIEEITRTDTQAGHIGILVLDEGADFPNGAAIIHAWLNVITRQVLTGQLPDFAAFPGLAVTASTPQSDPRWKSLAQAEGLFHRLGEEGRLLLALPQPSQITAIQIVWVEGKLFARANSAIDGVFWAIVNGSHLDLGFELPPSHRDQIAHLTVLYGTVGDEIGALVLWNLDPIHLNSPAGDHLVRLMKESIGVKPVRERWLREGRDVPPEEIQSALAVAVKEGVHPDERGTYVAKMILSERKRREVPFSGLETDEEPDFAANLTGEFNDPEDAVLRSEEEALARRRVAELADLADSDGRALLEALLQEMQTGDPGMTDVARKNGWDPAAAEAVRKRLQRVKKKLT